MTGRRILRHILACGTCKRPVVDVIAPMEKPLSPFSDRALNRASLAHGTTCCGAKLCDLGAFKLVALWEREDDLALPPREDWHAPDCVCTECA